MRRLAALLVVATVAALSAAFAFASVRGSASGQATAKCANRTKFPGWLTVGTDQPSNAPWFGGGTPAGSKWKGNDPRTGQGFESAVAYAVATRLGIPHIRVSWMPIQFPRAFWPGPKPYDFDINQITYTPSRAKDVTFSDSYYDVNQAVVVLKGTPIASVRTRVALRKFKLGAQRGTGSSRYVTSTIKPTKRAASYQTKDAAVAALQSKKIDGLVVDLPTAFRLTAGKTPQSKILGQFPARPGGAHFGMVFQKGDPFAGCVNRALASLKKSGELKKLQQKWLGNAVGVPVLR